MEVCIQIPILWMMAKPTNAPAHVFPQRIPEPAYEQTPITSPRSLRQLSVFFLGGACLLASTAVTRKAIWRRQLRVPPRFYEANTNPHEYFSPFSDACQALNLATMNCISVAFMALGGMMWTFDIANLQEAQAILRHRLNYDMIYQSDEAVPRTISDILVAAGETRVQEGNGSCHDENSR